jgi:hypothetical protein
VQLVAVGDGTCVGMQGRQEQIMSSAESLSLWNVTSWHIVEWLMRRLALGEICLIEVRRFYFAKDSEGW